MGGLLPKEIELVSVMLWSDILLLEEEWYDELGLYLLLLEIFQFVPVVLLRVQVGVRNGPFAESSNRVTVGK